MIMVVMTPRETWTDERLDKFKASVNHRFDEVDRRLDRFESQMHTDIRGLRQSVNQLHNTVVVGFMGLAGLVASAVIFF